MIVRAADVRQKRRRRTEPRDHVLAARMHRRIGERCTVQVRRAAGKAAEVDRSIGVDDDLLARDEVRVEPRRTDC